jgi:hypothetical protein
MGDSLSGTILADFLKTMPLGKLGEPQQFSHAVNFLIENNFMNGTYVRLDGGLRMGYL